MPSALMFWRFPDEEDDFVRFLESTGPVVAFAFEKLRTSAELEPRPMRQLLETTEPEDVLIGLADWTDAVRVHEFEDDDGPYYMMHPSDSPLLEYRRGRVDASGALTSSKLVGQWRAVDPSGNRLVGKRDDFVGWGKKVMRWIRSATPEARAPDERMTPRVAAALHEGLELVR